MEIRLLIREFFNRSFFFVKIEDTPLHYTFEEKGMGSVCEEKNTIINVPINNQ